MPTELQEIPDEVATKTEKPEGLVANDDVETKGRQSLSEENFGASPVKESTLLKIVRSTTHS